ncbi:hypothetical protein K505DRAFT_390679 [Melanomma pulvis-pyrius CBS 109.77]|uniref:Uncharacterized protein n=1 Tax=Melanomma pulvis-pyrius CBS 109.77 TaxID=1314802 RepID=A0A6A6XRE4_9PLEO|nr:hypothetical protein K505DRAFT_390679 [Melanomma pulvis-pyrius CBS 109.77]
MGRHDTSLYKWPDLQGGDQEGETYDTVNGFHVYPRTITTEPPEEEAPIATAQDLDAIRKRVAAVLKCLDMPVHIGDIMPIIVSDLAVFAAEKERDLLPPMFEASLSTGLDLPRLLTRNYSDHSKPIFRYDISDECKDMLRKKIQRAQVQHADDLAQEGLVDIAITWYCGPDSETPGRLVMATPDENNIMARASRLCYGSLDGDRMHAKPRPKEDPNKKWNVLDHMDPRWMRYEENLPQPSTLGGFYACVPINLLPQLMGLRESWNIDVITIVKPKHMTAEEQAEMNEYHTSRRTFKEEAIAQKQAAERAATKSARESAQKEHDARRAATYHSAVRASVDRLKYLDLHYN